MKLKDLEQHDKIKFSDGDDDEVYTIVHVDKNNNQVTVRSQHGADIDCDDDEEVEQIL